MKSFRKLSFFLFSLMFFISLFAFNSPVAYASSQAWETIGSDAISNDGIISIKMALDSHDTPYVAYGNNSQIGVLKKFDGANWITVGDTFNTNNDNNSLAVKIDSHDIPYVAYVFCGTLTVMKYVDSAWDRLPDITTSPRYVGLALDSHDTPYVAYKNSNDQISVKKFEGSSWVDVGNESFIGQGVDNVCLAFDKNDVLYVAYEYRTAPWAVTVYRFDGTDWQSLGNVGPTNRNLFEVNLAVGGNGTPYVSFWDGGASYLYRFEDTNWQLCGDALSSCSNAGFAIDSRNYPYLAYLSSSNSGQLKKYNYQQNTWEDVGGSISPSRIDMVSVAFDSQDQPYVACKDTANVYHPRLYAYRTHYSLSYTADTNGGLSGTPVQDVIKGGSGTAINAVPDDHYHFVKWSDDNPSASRTDSNVQGDMALSASFAIDTHTVHFDSQGGSKADDKTADYNTTIARPYTDRTGYTFAGWYTTKECDDPSPVTFPYTVTEDTTLYAKWNINNYTVQFDSQGGSNVDDRKADYNTTIAQPADPVMTGYTFAGWYTTKECDDPAPSAFPYTVTGNATLYAKWNINNYTVQFDSQGGSKVDDKKADYNTAIAQPDTNRKGYIFLGWYTKNESDTTPVKFPYTVTSDATFYAKWIPSTHTVTFDPGTGATVDPVNKTVTYDAAYGPLSVPAKKNYDFNGWYTGTNGTGRHITSSDTVDITSDITLHAYWQAYSLYLSAININGGKLGPRFNKTNLNYTLNLGENEGSVIITPVKADAATSVTIDGDSTAVNKTVSLDNGGSQTVRVIVSSMGKSKMYKIIANRAKSTNCSLASLSADSGKISPSFDPNQKNYTISLGESTQSVTITDTAAPHAKSSFYSKIVTLKNPGDQKTIKLTVKAQSGKTRTYTITVKRAKSTDAYLFSLTTKPEGLLNPVFKNNVTTGYNVTLPAGITSVTLYAKAEGYKATVKFINTTTGAISNKGCMKINVASGKTIYVTIEVTPQDAAAPKIDYYITVNGS